ncbi:MAG: helix-turn-helix domain-containing protein [Eubacteriales bacterium]|nr:helix-turn-helix domain-containing protein [Eubacteriales bacterium]
MRKEGKRIKYKDRKKIERMIQNGEKVAVIAKNIGVHRATIYNELKRGGSPYKAEEAQRNI